ncbi:D-Tyr-tRNAtyr deacylase [Paraburkholderia youngii]
MIALIQRVRRAEVRVADRVTGAIDAGLLALVCAERGDTEAVADKLPPRCSATACSATRPAR